MLIIKLFNVYFSFKYTELVGAGVNWPLLDPSWVPGPLEWNTSQTHWRGDTPKQNCLLRALTRHTACTGLFTNINLGELQVILHPCLPGPVAEHFPWWPNRRLVMGVNTILICIQDCCDRYEHNPSFTWGAYRNWCGYFLTHLLAVWTGYSPHFVSSLVGLASSCWANNVKEKEKWTRRGWQAVPVAAGTVVAEVP
jgi:hypothetical protein